MRISEFIEKTNAAASPDEVFQLFRGAVEKYGFDVICLAAASPAAQHAFPLRPAGPAVALTCPQDWIAHYLAKHYDEIDPILLYAARSRRPYRWSDVIAAGGMSPKQRLILEESREAGLCNGVTIPLHGPGGEAYVISLATDKIAHDSQPFHSDLHMLAVQFYVAFASLARGPTIDTVPPHLSRRERECLSWTAKGKSAWAISMILGVSANTVNFHLKSAMKKLGTTNRVQAVALAVHSGLIQP